VVEVPEVVEQLGAAATTMGPAWEQHRSLWEDDPAGAYNDLGFIAQHVVRLLGQDRVDEAGAIFNVVEELLNEPLSKPARNALILGFLEDVQTITSHADSLVPSSAFIPLCGPATLAAWFELHRSWGTRDT